MLLLPLLDSSSSSLFSRGCLISCARPRIASVLMSDILENETALERHLAAAKLPLPIQKLLRGQECDVSIVTYAISTCTAPCLRSVSAANGSQAGDTTRIR